MIRKDLATGAVDALADLTWERVPAGRWLPGSPLVLTEANCQCLAEDLWRLGYRPRHVEDRSGEIARLEAHAADLTRMIDRVEKLTGAHLQDLRIQLTREVHASPIPETENQT